MEYRLPFRIFLIASVFLSSFDIFSNSIITAEKSSFTPNLDGKEDVFVFKIRSESLPILQDWELNLKNSFGETVRTFHADRRRRKNFTWFWDENEYAPEEIRTPEYIEWNGEDEAGNLLPDGIYSYQLLLVTRNKERILSEESSIYLDSKSPKVEVTCRNRLLLFGDRSLSKIIFQQKATAESSDILLGEFLDKEGRSFKSYTWKIRDLPSNLVWDGTDSNGRQVAPGLYTYRLTARDPAGNESVQKVENISVREENVGADLNVEGSLFPSDPRLPQNRLKFFSYLSPKLKSDSYEWEVLKRSGEDEKVLYSHRSLGEPPAEWNWEPKTNDGKVLSEGEYFYRLTIYSRYDKIVTHSKKFTLTDEKAKISYDLGPEGFTPDGNWEKDNLVIRLQSKGLALASWKLTLFESYGENEVEERIVKTWVGGSEMPSNLIWSGSDEQGRRIGSLAPLKVVLNYKDIFGREEEKNLGEIRSGILVLEEKEGYRISIPERMLEERWWTLPSRLRSLLKTFPGYFVEVQYHTSHRGDDQFNLRFSEEKVIKIFRSLLGKDHEFERYRFRGYGETLPLIPGNGSYETERNQRLDFFLSNRK
ncbi:cell envelope biogenesis protein OmpA [Leptospira perolatii]|uniref:Cell envelope biogenesis protein OmpA n=1 Tax=Leptospira perolatii TaxID=2023191 RepID=A0A2M9ZMJ0_9LEPT|nr:cell envelope biogenesis protein OmpA [Leptospira perolatii]PJZ73163.1 cell envelope biogenesis protein OmpA [Leptospira perolatii]